MKPTITQAKNAGAAAIVTIPIVDYVAADKNGGCDVRNSGADYLQTRFKQNRSTKPSALSLTPNATDGTVYEDEYVNWVKQAVPGANVVFSLDNEPDLWSSTHAEVHPSAVTYTELANRNIDYATAIKRVWPTAKVTGPVNYGFYGFETLQNAPDAAGKGNFLDWYLDQIKAAGTTAGPPPRRRPRPALVPGGHRRRGAHHRHRHLRGRRGGPGAGPAIAVGSQPTSRPAGSRVTTATAPSA